MKKLLSTILCLIAIFSTVTISAFAENESSLTLDAKSCILMEQTTGKILYAQNEHERLYPASVTKIMTILLVTEALDSGKIALTDVVTASTNAASKGGSQIWLKEGEQMTVEELLRASVIASANDACTALGEHIAGSEEAAVKMMNDRAKELGMNDTHFDNCTGLDDDSTTHLTSAYDIAIMSKELLSHERIKTYSTVWMDSLRDGATQLVNTNKLVRFYKGTTGLKTGTTSKAGHCISASAERNGLHLIAVIMGSSTGAERFESAKTLLNWGFANYETVTPTLDEGLMTEVNVIKGIENTVKPYCDNIKPVILKSGMKGKLEAVIDLAAEVEAPVEENQTLGTVRFTVDGEAVCEYKLKAERSVRRLKLSDILIRLISSLSTKML